MNARLIALLLGSATQLLGPAWAQCPSGSTELSPPGANSWITDAVAFDDGSGPALYISGWFTNVGGSPALRVARWHGNAFSGGGWSAVGAGFDGVVYDLAVLDLGDGPHLYAAGSGGSGGYVARWRGTSWESLGAGLGLGVRTIAAYDVAGVPRLFAGGSYQDAHENYLPMVIQRVNGAWSFVPNGPMTIGQFPFPDEWLLTGSVDSMIVHDDGSGPALYVGGSYHLVGNTPCMNLSSWDGASWRPVGAAGIGVYPYAIRDMCVFDDGWGPALFLAESHTGTSCVKRWNGSIFESVGGSFVGGVGGFVTPGPLLGRPTGLWAVGVRGPSPSQPSILYWDGIAWMADDLPNAPGSTDLHAIAAFEEAGTARLFAVGNFLSNSPAAQHILRFDGAAFSAVVGCTEVGETFCHGDGVEAACPCGNDSVAGDRAGCLNSLGTGGRMRAEGRASLSDDALVLRGTQMPNSSVLYFQAGTRHAPIPFGDGLKCTGGPFVRLFTATNAAQGSSYPAAGQDPISQRGQIGAPGTRYYQARYRNASDFCTAATFNYTNAVTIVWGL